MAANGTVIVKPPSNINLKTRPASAKEVSICCCVRFRGWLSPFSMKWTARWVIPVRLPSSVWLQPSTALLALTFAAKSSRPISLAFDVDLPGRRFFTVPPSIKKRTPADELPGFPISYLDQAIRAGSRGEHER
jgi:hypothetical protein